MMEAVLPFTTKRFARAIIMPNLAPNPVVTTEDARAYKKRIEEAQGGAAFTPLMTYYLTENSSAEDMAKGFREKLACAVKLYPAGATTNSAQGVTNIKNVYSILETLQKIGMPILLHGETTLKDGHDVPAMDREKVFLDTTLPMLLKDFPSLKIVLEHATTKNAVDVVLGENSPRLGSTLTLHHLMVTNDEAEHAEKPAYLHCMPIIKNTEDRKALRAAAASGNVHFFLGTDSAPHPMSAKEREKPAAGIFTAPAALELYAQVFEEEGKLENFEKFASLNGPAFYGMKPNEEKITLKKETWTIDSLIEVSNGEKIRPFGYDEDPAKRIQIGWRIV